MEFGGAPNHFAHEYKSAATYLDVAANDHGDEKDYSYTGHYDASNQPNRISSRSARVPRGAGSGGFTPCTTHTGGGTRRILDLAHQRDRTVQRGWVVRAAARMGSGHRATVA
jgi:hypothetical protein